MYTLIAVVTSVHDEAVEVVLACVFMNI